MFRVWSVLVVVILFSAPSLAQDVQVRGRFLADSLKIGEPVPYSLTARYPQQLNVLFPDSTYAFAPFEFTKKNFFDTRTKDSVSYDSVVYLLASYEVDSVQQLRLPVFVVHPSDCTTIFAENDVIFLKHLVKNVPDSIQAPQLPLKTQTSYLNVKWLFNYPLWLIIGGVLLVLAIVGWLIFGKRIRRYFRIKRLLSQHQQFIDRFENAVSQLAGNYSAPKAEKALVVWKQYMEDLESRPFTKYTSKEILLAEKNDRLARALKQIDRMIYAGLGNETQTLEELKSYSQEKFNQKLEAVKHE